MSVSKVVRRGRRPGTVRSGARTRCVRPGLRRPYKGQKSHAIVDTDCGSWNLTHRGATGADPYRAMAPVS